MPASAPLTTINAVKDLEQTYQPLLLCELRWLDAAGDVSQYLRLAAYDVTYPDPVLGNVAYAGRLLNPDVAAAQCLSANGIAMAPAVTLQIADADGLYFNTYENDGGPGMKGARLYCYFVFYDPAANTFSTNRKTMFIGTCSSPSVDDSRGVLTLSAISALNMATIMLPAIHIQRRCPWLHPDTAEQKLAAQDFLSWYWNCGDSDPAHTSCDSTAKYCKETNNNLLRFGGIQWRPAPDWYSRPFTSDGHWEKGAQGINENRYTDFVPIVLGRHLWITPPVLDNTGDANYSRFEILITQGQCMAEIGAGQFADDWVVVCNGHQITQAAVNSSWDQAKNGFWDFITTGNRTGSPCVQDGYHSQGDPFGSMTVIYLAVMISLAASSSAPSVQIKCNGGWIPIWQGPEYGPTNYTPSGYVLQISESPVWQLLYILMAATWTLGEIDIPSWGHCAERCALAVSYTTPAGNPSAHDRYKSGLVLRQQRSIPSLTEGLLNNFNGMLAIIDDKLHLLMRETLGEEQPAPIDGSNDATPYASMTVGYMAHPSVSQNGYVAYHFDESSILKVNGRSSFAISQGSLQDTPNRISITFQDEENDSLNDSTSIVDSDDVTRTGAQRGMQVLVDGIRNFDQAGRISRSMLAQKLRGNPNGTNRNGTQGTWMASFTTTVRGVHLRPGHIVAISSLRYNLVKQLFRIEAIKPTANYEQIQIQSSWHEDYWYTTAYGQTNDPGPYASGSSWMVRPPFEWQPFLEPIRAGDPLHPGEYTYQMRLSYANNSDLSMRALLTLSGRPTVNLFAPPAFAPPYQSEDLQLITGGALATGMLYYVALAARATYTDSAGVLMYRLTTVNRPKAIYIPAGSAARTIRIPNIVWPGSSTPSGYVLFAGLRPETMSVQATELTQPSTLDIAGPLKINGWGLPDVRCSAYFGQVFLVRHAGVWGRAIYATPTSNSMQFPGAAWAANDKVGRIVSVISSMAGGAQHVLNYKVASNTADTLTLQILDNLTADGVVGGVTEVLADVAVLRMTAVSAGPNWFEDPALINIFSGGAGLTPDAEKGCLVRILDGTGAGQAKRIQSNTATRVVVEPWDVVPDNTSILIIQAATPDVEITSDTVANSYAPDDAAAPLATMTLDVTNYKRQTIMVEVLAVDSNGRASFEPQRREIYVRGQAQRTEVTITHADSPYAMTGTIQVVHCDTSAGQIQINLADAANFALDAYVVEKTTPDANPVIILPSSNDGNIAFTDTVILTKQAINGDPAGVVVLQPKH